MTALSTAPESQTASKFNTTDLNGVYDLEALVDRCMGDADLAAKLLDRFGQRLSTTVGEIQQSVNAGERSAVLTQTHTLKGEAGSLAAVRLQEAASELEACVRKAHNRQDAEIFRLTVALTAAAEQCRQRLPRAVEALAMSAKHA